MSDSPTATSEPAAAPAASCRNVTTERRLRMPNGDEGAFSDTSRDIAQSKDFILPLDDGIEHNGGADVRDDEEQLQEHSQEHAVVGAGTDDVARVVQPSRGRS
jgi:hypothetical protein